MVYNNLIPNRFFYIPEKPLKFYGGLLVAVLEKIKIKDLPPFYKYRYNALQFCYKYNTLPLCKDNFFKTMPILMIFDHLYLGHYNVKLASYYKNGRLFNRILDIVDNGDTLAVVCYGDPYKGSNINPLDIDEIVADKGLDSAIEVIKAKQYFRKKAIPMRPKNGYGDINADISNLKWEFLQHGFDMFSDRYKPDSYILYKAFYEACLNVNRGSEKDDSIPDYDLVLEILYKIIKRIG